MEPKTNDELARAFPDIDPNYKPFGGRVVVQLRLVPSVSKGGIILTQDTKDTEHWNTQVGKVVAHGPLAYHNRTTSEPWPEGQWAPVGSFVRIQKYGGDRFQVAVPGSFDTVTFVQVNDYDILGAVPDPLAVKAFL